jgi:site-specific recombinase XerD
MMAILVGKRAGSPFTTAGLARMIERAAAGAGLELKAHPHMLRHACGYALANKGHDTRRSRDGGHRSITNTAVYTALAPNRFPGRPVSLTQRPPLRSRGTSEIGYNAAIAAPFKGMLIY